MSDVTATTDRWAAACAQLAAGQPADDDAVATFVAGDLVDGRGRTADPHAVADAWSTLLDRAPRFGPALVDRLLGLGARVGSGMPIRGLSLLLREARPAAELKARLGDLAAADPTWAGAALALAYWLDAP